VQDVVEPALSSTPTVGNSYRRLSKLDYDHRPRTQRPGRVAADD
jgi:hypothetical protein